jgi:outer membrane receptor protein involved in Fe transport
MKRFKERKKWKSAVFLTVTSSVALSCSITVLAQSNNVTVEASPPSSGSTNATQSAAATNINQSTGATNVTQLGNITVVGKLNQARSEIVPNLGATAYTHTAEQIQMQSLGGNAPFTQVILRSPGVAQDSEINGGVHVRGEHANLQYRINDVLLPEGITGFGQELDPRFVDSMQLITGSLPAQYGFRTAGIVDIQTKGGSFQNGGQAEMYGGSYDTIRPSFELGGSQGKWNLYANWSYEQNSLGIENPTASKDAIHDDTQQYKGFLYGSYIIDDTSRLTAMGSLSYSQFQVPNTPGLPPGMAPGGSNWVTGTFDSSTLNENQNEQNYYGVLAYQKEARDLNYQASVFGRNSSVHFVPDQTGDLFFNGVASDVDRNLYSGGFQLDSSYALGDKHTIRAGAMVLGEYLLADANNNAILMQTNVPSDPAFNPLPGSPTTNIVQNNVEHALFAGAYLQDEWKILQDVTLNYGVRLDEYDSSFDNEFQASPRVNVIWQATDLTTLHAGYARYFTPPPLENVPSGDVNAFDGTANESPSGPNAPNDPIKAERANYFDAGISHRFSPHLQVGVDGYYKYAKNQLDDGLFGQTLILQAFNYARGRIYGTEFTASYNLGGFSSYANFAWSVAQGEDWSSAQFLFDPVEAGYVQNHWIYLDHDQQFSGSFGTAYTWNEARNTATSVYADLIYGSGLRQNGGGNIPGTTTPIPNGATVPQYYSINVGVAQSFNILRNKMLTARLDVVNVTDNIYQLRSGSGVGVNAAQYGMRLGFFGSVSLVF